MQPEVKNTTMQYGLLQLLTLPAAAIFGFYANASEYILEYLVFPNAFDHAVNLQ